MAVAYADMNLERAVAMSGPDTDGADLLHELAGRRSAVATQQDRFRQWCDRADRLFYAEDMTTGGADLWGDHPSAHRPGRAHVSINSPDVYVTVPAALQAVEPIENMLATDTTDEARTAAAALERVYYAWKREEQFELKVHKACVAKGLYGRTAARVYWDAAEKRPCIEIIDQPRNLWLGYKTDAYDELEWSAYVQRMSPNAVIEEFSVDIDARDDGKGNVVPFPRPAESGVDAMPSRSWLSFGPAMVEVWDYWYRRPKGKLGKVGSRTKMSVWNAVFVGPLMVRNEEYPEYGDSLPIVPLFNTYLPGVPDGRSDLYDMEQLIREKNERVTSGSQMIQAAVGGNFWQLTGPEAPDKVSPNAKPRLNEVIAPGAGNRIEAITPFIPQFQLEQYLGRLDREMAAVSGLNDLLLGLAPAQVLSSSKAINALIANYEARISLRRALLYAWRGKVWSLAVRVWSKKEDLIAEIVEQGSGMLDIRDPSLIPRDEMETATTAANLVAAQLISAARGMDMVGVDDPETEQDIIREENTDATLNPAKVQVMAQLMAALQSLGLQVPQQVQGQAEQQLASGQNDLRTALAGAVPQGTNASQGPEMQGILPPEAGTPGPGGVSPETPLVQPPPGAEVGLAQNMITAGKLKSRLLSQQKIGRR